MKLFQRTLLSFIGIIILQTFLTTILVTDSIRKAQSEDAQRQLKTESLTVYDNFNAWKRVLWGEIVDINADVELKKALDTQATVVLNDAIIGQLRSFGERTKAEYLIARNGATGFTDIIRLTDKPVPVPDTGDFTITKSHPYIEVAVSEGVIYIGGNVRLTGKKGNYADIFLLKRVDEDLCRQLTFNPRFRVLVSVGNLSSVGTLKSDSFSAWLDGKKLATAYASIDEIRQDGSSYSAVVQQSGVVRVAAAPSDAAGEAASVDADTAGETLYVATFFSLSEYRQRLEAINRAVLFVSVIIAAITLAISFGLTATITSPIRKLRDAMLSVKAGKFDTEVAGPRKGEIAELLRGFNEMAKQLSDDNAALAKYIGEIVYLKEYNEKVFNSIREGIVVVNSAFIAEKVNHAFLDSFGLEEGSVAGGNVGEIPIGLFDESLKASVRAVLDGRLSSDVSTRRTPDGRSFEIKLYPLYEASAPENERYRCILIIEDVSSKIAYEENIFRAEKLAGISMLSAGVAHEINNPLGSILTNVQNLIAEEGNGRRTEDLLIIEQETKRIARIVRDLLNFASSKREDASGARVNTVVEEVLKLIGYSVKNESPIVIEADLGADLPPAAMGEDELKQITINLLRNSLQALDSMGLGAGAAGNVIGISTKRAEAEGMIELTVRDTGPGIPREDLSRIFDPFFTTKAGEGNAGLGLSVVYGIVTKRGGSVSAESAPGSGTTMRVLIPAERRDGT